MSDLSPSPTADRGVVAIITHPAVEFHDPGRGHPESRARTATIWSALRSQTRVHLSWSEAEPASREDVGNVHAPEYLDSLDARDKMGGGMLDPDTVMDNGSLEAAYGAAGAAIMAAEVALAGTPAFAAVRPPGHHASRQRAMGFCFINNVALAAATMLARHGLDRVLIVDWDVHHGNGTQDIFAADPRVRYVSMHQSPHYPGTGAETERGVGNLFNVPRPPGLPAATYVADLLEAVRLATGTWQPDLVLLSAGFDSMRGDPLGGFTLEPDDYATLTRNFAGLGCPVASVLEGGYAPERVADGVLSHVEELGRISA